MSLKKELRGEEEEAIKAAELRKLEQGGGDNGGIHIGVQVGSKRKQV